MTPLRPPMHLLSPEILDTASRSVLCWLATVSPDGRPKVSPKEIWAIADDSHLVIANIASPTSVRNVRHSMQACVSFIDVFVQKGFKLTGEAVNLERTHPSFQRWAGPLLSKAEPRFLVRSVIVVRVEAVGPILAAVDTRHAASIRVLEKCLFERIRQEASELHGEKTEDFIYRYTHAARPVA